MSIIRRYETVCFIYLFYVRYISTVMLSTSTRCRAGVAWHEIAVRASLRFRSIYIYTHISVREDRVALVEMTKSTTTRAQALPQRMWRVKGETL